MLTAEYQSDGTYIIRMDLADRHKIAEIAVGFSIPKEAAMVAVVNRGFDSIVLQLKKEAANKTFGPIDKDKDRGGD